MQSDRDKRAGASCAIAIIAGVLIMLGVCFKWFAGRLSSDTGAFKNIAASTERF